MPGKVPIRLSEAEAQRLAQFYADAEIEILNQLNRALLRGNKTEYLRAMLDNVNAILEDLRAGSRTWCETAIPRAYVASTKFTDAQLKAAGATRMVAGFGAIHQQAAQVLAEAAYKRFDETAVTIGRRVDDIYRTLALENVRGSVTGYKTWEQVARNFREQLAEQGVTGFKDKRGRQWNMRSYSEMVARTTTMEAHLEGTKNRLLEHGYDLIEVSSHSGACELCVPWEGRILSLTGKTPGYPTLQEAKDAGLFHPNCRHAYGLHIDIDKEIENLDSELGESGGQDTQGRSGIDPKQVPSDIPVSGIPQTAKLGIARAMSDALAHGLRTQTECLLTLDATTGKTVYNKLTGIAGEVRFTQQLTEILNRARPHSIVLVHNHPSSSAFSDADLVLLGHFDSLRGLFVIGHDRTMYYMGRKGSNVLSEAQLLVDYQRYFTKYFGHYNDLATAGKMSGQAAWREHSHRIMEDLAKALHLEYVRWSG